MHGCISAEFSFDAVTFFDGFAEAADGLFVQVFDACFRRDGAFFADIFCSEPSYAVDGGEGDFHAFGGGDVDSGDACHGYSPRILR